MQIISDLGQRRLAATWIHCDWECFGRSFGRPWLILAMERQARNSCILATRASRLILAYCMQCGDTTAPPRAGDVCLGICTCCSTVRACRCAATFPKGSFPATCFMPTIGLRCDKRIRLPRLASFGSCMLVLMLGQRLNTRLWQGPHPETDPGFTTEWLRSQAPDPLHVATGKIRCQGPQLRWAYEGKPSLEDGLPVPGATRFLRVVNCAPTPICRSQIEVRNSLE
jgi:hypothetical protein